MRKFPSGATRNNSDHKLDYEGFIDPKVERRFAEYMHVKRLQADGVLRDSDNWQKGIPITEYMKSLVRHTFDLWICYRGETIYDVDTGDETSMEEIACAIKFNINGLLHELLKQCQTKKLGK